MFRATLTFFLILLPMISAISACSAGDANQSSLISTADRDFSAHLTNAPTGADTKATGEATFAASADGKQIQYTLVVESIDNVTMAHIHEGQAKQEGAQEGPILVWLYPPGGSSPKEISGTFSGTLAESTITEANLEGPLKGKPVSALIETLQKGDGYVNVHTQQYPGGAIAGQIEATAGQMQQRTPTPGATH